MKNLTMNKTIITGLITLLSYASLAQSPIQINRNRFYQDNERLSVSQVAYAVRGIEEAAQYAKKAKSNYGAANVFGFIGGFLIGWPIGTAIAGQVDPEWSLAGAGAGALLIAIPFANAGNKNMKQAISIYNQSLATGSRVKLGFNFQGNRAGLALHF